MKALVVNDNPDFQCDAIKRLEREGYAIEVARSGWEAEQKLKSLDYRLVLWQMNQPRQVRPA